MTDEKHDKPKIIIDEDWKAQVEREREEARQAERSTEQGSAPDDATATPEPDLDAELPPASFAFLVSSLATQAMAALGQLPDPISNKAEIHLPLAKHHIDTLAVLEEKTKNNLTAPESTQLETVLHQLRMLYIAVGQHR